MVKDSNCSDWSNCIIWSYDVLTTLQLHSPVISISINSFKPEPGCGIIFVAAITRMKFLKRNFINS